MDEEISICVAMQPDLNKHSNVKRITFASFTNTFNAHAMGEEFAEFLFNNAAGVFVDALNEKMRQLERE